MTVTGSCLPPDLCDKIDTCVLNVAARRILGVSQAARIGVLHMVANTHTFKNHYVVHCALRLDAVLRASNSSIKERIERELKRIYKVRKMGGMCPMNLEISYVSYRASNSLF